MNYNKESKFTFIDFEVANRLRSSICSVGISVFENGAEVDSFYSLIRPEPFKIELQYQKVHGITYADVANAPSFEDVFPQIKPFLKTYVVAHNAEFDMDCLSTWLFERKMAFPDFKYVCTKKIADILGEPSNSLEELCSIYGIEVCQIHNALCDARACGELFFKLLPKLGNGKLNDISAEFGTRVYKEFEQSERIISRHFFDGVPLVEVEDAEETKNDLPYQAVDSIDFSKNFVVTGEFLNFKRRELEAKIKARGGKLQSMPNSKTAYIIIGGIASDGWANGNYGRKIEAALELPNVTFVRESDFLKFI